MSSVFQVLKEKLFVGFYKKDVTHDDQYPSSIMRRMDKGTNTSDRINYGDYMKFIAVDADRKLAYKDFEEMDTDIIASALDLLADDATQYNLKDGQSFYIDCSDVTLKKELTKLYFDVLQMDEHIWDITRMVTKYGDFMLRVIGEKGNGISYCDYSIHPSRVVRIDEKGFIKYFIQDKKTTFKPWEFVHFRLPGSIDRSEEDLLSGIEEEKDNFKLCYGVSVIYKSRRIWKQLRLLEDSIVLSRLSRSFKRNIFAVNTGSLKETAAWALVSKISALLKRNRAVNTSSNSMNSQSNLLNPEEDVVIPVASEKGSLNITELGGDVDIQHIADLDYMNNKLFASIKIPKAFLGFENELNGKNTLRMQDVRYARTIKNIQRVLIKGLEHLGRIHLAYLGIDPVEADFQIRMPYISTIEEMEKAEVLSSKSEVVSKLMDIIRTVDEDGDLIDKKKLLLLLFRDLDYMEEDIRDLFNVEYKTGVKGKLFKAGLK